MRVRTLESVRKAGLISYHIPIDYTVFREGVGAGLMHRCSFKGQYADANVEYQGARILGSQLWGRTKASTARMRCTELVPLASGTYTVYGILSVSGPNNEHWAPGALPMLARRQWRNH